MNIRTDGITPGNARNIYVLMMQVCATLTMCLATNTCCGQKNEEVDFEMQQYPFVHNERNMIINAVILDTFFENLYQQKEEGNKRIHILQIGDSHIQADFLSAQVRADFQTDFGNAGRGLVVPLRVAGTNEPFNYKITSNVVCTSKRCVFVNDPLPIGIGGVTIQTTSDSVYFNIKTFDTPGQSYGFNKLTLFYQKDSSFDFRVEDTTGKELARISSAEPSEFANTSTVKIPVIVSNIILRAEPAKPHHNIATIFGLNLENDSAGVIYSSVGVNGAEAYQYVHAQFFAEETHALTPDLFIISLGTNEAQRRPLDKALTYARFDSLVKQLQQYNPNTPIILTTPPDSYSRKKYYNPSVAAVHEVLVNYAKEHNLACWDLFSATGGYKSCYSWKKHGLMRKDGIHFNREGYELQANLLYTAIIKAYNHYVSHRHS